MGLFFPKYKLPELKNYGAVHCDYNERVIQNLKKKLTHGFKNDMSEELVNLTQSSHCVQIPSI